MFSTAIAESLENRRAYIDAALAARLPGADSAPGELHRALRHAVLAPGKRLRPILSLAAAEFAGQAPEDILDTACAVEFIHTASLILDDLPCMDDAASRRGAPCTHHDFGEATAILAAMALVTEAFDLVARNAAALGAPAEGLAAVRELARCVGTQGVISGQHTDLNLAEHRASLDELAGIYSLKAGALFAASLTLPGRLFGLNEGERNALARYAEGLGLAFQIADDLIDAEHEERGSARTSFSTHLGNDGARQRVAAHVNEALAAIAPFGERAATLRLVVQQVAHRAQQR